MSILLGKGELQEVSLNLGEGGCKVCDCHFQNESTLRESKETRVWKQ